MQRKHNGRAGRSVKAIEKIASGLGRRGAWAFTLAGDAPLFQTSRSGEFYRRLGRSRGRYRRPSSNSSTRSPCSSRWWLSAQATDVGVNKATPALFALADTPAKMLNLGEERIVERIRTIGLFRTKAKNLMALSRILVEQHGGEVPRDRAALETLPGVGRKTASVVLNVAFGEPTIAGRHAHLPCRQPHRDRTGEDAAGRWRPGSRPARPAEYKHYAHHWLILHGRYVCKARKPECPILRRRRPLPLRREDRPRRDDRGAGERQRTRKRWPKPSSTPPAAGSRQAAGGETRGQLATRTLATSAMDIARFGNRLGLDVAGNLPARTRSRSGRSGGVPETRPLALIRRRFADHEVALEATTNLSFLDRGGTF